ncbi:hypothetical protein PSM36_1151 [Proteiniphilum saccharofermentans]|uniref:DUF349 domain-containing protein n=1 Tax=Proteiniphilum saccharofermentans TaxID=1642647 RepID=A0A1R3SUH2_9BACT|nr:DUF349 domain-containing protein [Proteiniphilum saccharofermentans]SCD19976.1 hypothetical protein PSM36_1151 [Proteiniphilum saccharofermentans]
MNTKNNPDNEKLPVKEDQNNKDLQSELPKEDSAVEIPQTEIPAVEEPEKDDLPETGDIASEEVTGEELPESKGQEDETEQTVVKSTNLNLEEVIPEEKTTQESTTTEEVIEEEKGSEEKTVKEPEPIDVSEEATVEEESTIDYDLDDGNGVPDSEDEEDADEDSFADDVSVTLLPIEEIVRNLRDLLTSESPKRKDVDEYKNQFYRSLRNETESQKQEFLSKGGEEIDFIGKEPEIYTEGKELIQKIKEKRADILAKEDAEKEKNVARKLAIIEQVKVLTETQGQEDFNKIYQEFKSLQQEWNEIKLIPQEKVNELWKSYQRYVEKFYDLVRINNEFREYDFKKNLEIKTELCEAAERLNDETDIVSAFHQLQNLHQEWREVGPVSRKEREEIWTRFKEASTQINKKYQAHFEQLREKENENLELKTALCEKLEAIDYSQLKSVKDWNNKVKEVLEIQSQWRQIGFVPRKWNTKIYKRYRAACDFFFRSKNEFYKSLRGEMEENLKKKTALCERAEALKDSQDWKSTTREMIEIQKEWKTIGIVPHKYVDSIWKRFISACDYFFEQKKLHTSSQYEQEQKNLNEKKAIIDKINQLDTSLETEEALAQLHELMDKWYEIGHVPYKMKDRIYKEFYDATEAQFDRLNIGKAERKLEAYKSTISDMARSDNSKGQLLREREKLVRQYERIKNELQTYENNIGFLSVSSKKGNHLLDDMNQKVEKIKSELILLEKKIRAIEDEL